MFLFEWWECLARRLYRWLLSLGELSAGGLDEFVLLVALGGGTAGHVGFTTAFAADDGGEVFDEVACSESGVMGVLATEGAEVEFVAIVHDEEGGLGEVKLFEAVDEFLQEVGRTVEGVDEVAGETSIFGELGKEGISRVAVVTHAWHMPRAIEVFEAAGLSVLPAPTIRATPPANFRDAIMPRSRSFRDSSWAIHEWVGRLWYRL